MNATLSEERRYWNSLSKFLTKRELNEMYPNGYISFAVKLHRDDKDTLHLLDTLGLLLTNKKIKL